MEIGNASSEVYKLVRRHVPEAELARQHGKEISLILPHNSVSNFASLFNELETEIHQNGNRLHISSYGISMTTLEEVS
jgi:ATP-binding cassette subfamily A (ABC1) protein 5